MDKSSLPIFCYNDEISIFLSNSARRFVHARSSFSWVNLSFPVISCVEIRLLEIILTYSDGKILFDVDTSATTVFWLKNNDSASFHDWLCQISESRSK